MAKRYLPLHEAVNHSDVPFDSVKQLRNAAWRARRITDSSGAIQHPGDPEFLACFIRVSRSERGPLLCDVQRLARLLDQRRLSDVA